VFGGQNVLESPEGVGPHNLRGLDKPLLRRRQKNEGQVTMRDDEKKLKVRRK
jgi:hypothetical protein